VNRICSTRALKNAKFIRTVAPDVIPLQEPSEGFGSIIPLDVLRRFGGMSEAELTDYPELLDAWRALPSPPGSQFQSKLFGAPPFKGTLYFVQLTFFFTGGGSITVDRVDVATAIQYATLAVRPISAYCAQYGANRLDVSPDIIEYGPVFTNTFYNDDGVQHMVNTILSQNHLSADSSCIILLNPPGMTNTDGALADGVGGYHDKADAPYCFVNVGGAGPLTVADRSGVYADSLSHEIAEMTCDPDASIFNDEVCDGCAGNCANDWQNYFVDPAPSLANSYLRSSKGIPASLPYTYYIASIASRIHAGDCPAPESGCAYPPPNQIGPLMAVPPAVSDPTAYEFTHEGRNLAEQHNLFRTADGHIDALWFNFETGWNHEDRTFRLGAPPAVGDSTPYAFVHEGRNLVEQHNLFRTGDGHIHALWFNFESGWHHEDRTAMLGAPPAVSDPVAYTFTHEGRNLAEQHNLFRSGDGHIHALWFNFESGWHHEDRTAMLGAPGSVGDPVAYTFTHERRNLAEQHNLFRTGDGHIHALWFNFETGWHHEDRSL
jgi:hypothetical protein